MSNQIKAGIAEVIENADPACEVVEVRLGHQGKKAHVLVLVDRDGGIDVEQLARLNRLVDSYLEETAAISGPYLLEVSSAGLERPLTKPQHFVRFRGRKVRLVLHRPRGQQAVVTGSIGGICGNRVTLETANGPTTVCLEEIKRANLVFEM